MKASSVRSASSATDAEKKSNGVLVIARQRFSILRHGQPLSDSESTAGESFSERQGGVAHNPESASAEFARPTWPACRGAIAQTSNVGH
jgi:hypothetical protein